MPRFHAGVSYGIFGSSLSFLSKGPDADIQRLAATVSLEYRISEESTAGGGLGAGLGGYFDVGGTRFHVNPGWLVTGTWSRRLVQGTVYRPFLLVGVAGGVSGASTTQEATGKAAPATASLYAIDVRVAVTLGWTLWRTISPYFSPRAFGGPVFWSYKGSNVIGGDTHHYQLAFGMAMALPRGFDLFVDGSPVGEQAVTLGGGRSF